MCAPPRLAEETVTGPVTMGQTHTGECSKSPELCPLARMGGRAGVSSQQASLPTVSVGSLRLQKVQTRHLDCEQAAAPGSFTYFGVLDASGGTEFVGCARERRLAV